MRQSTKSALSLGAAAFLLYLSFRTLDPGEVWESLSQASPLLLFLAVLLNTSHYLLRAYRWRRLLEHFRRGIALVSLLTTTFVGFLVTWIFPGRLGEFVRPFLLGRREGVPVSGAVSTVLLERIFDAGSVLILFGAALLWLPSAPLAATAGESIGPLVRSGRWFGLAALIVLPALYLLFRARLALFRVLEARAGGRGWRGTLLRWGREFAEGLHVLSAPRSFGLVVLYSLGLWVVIGLNTWLVLEAFHLDVPLVATFLFLPLPVLGIAVPTPGGVGSFEFFCRWGLENLFGAPADDAIAAAVGLHVVSLLPVALFGPVSIWKEGLSLRGILRDTRGRFAAGGGGKEGDR